MKKTTTVPKKRFFVAYYPKKDFSRVSTCISKFARKHGLRPELISKCLNHPETHYTHRGFKFMWMDARIRRPKTATSYMVKYVNKMQG